LSPRIVGDRRQCANRVRHGLRSGRVRAMSTRTKIEFFRILPRRNERTLVVNALMKTRRIGLVPL
jgi:hypothetical protein